jgi:CheY-like chemotaxis protein
MSKITTILIVDDDADDRELFCEAVQDIDKAIQCITVSNGEAALKLLDKENGPLPDYIFLDLNMPRLNGKQCLALIKSAPPLQHIPIIIYTTSKLKEDITETKRLGASYFITKPSKLKDLKKAISMVLEGKGTLIE